MYYCKRKKMYSAVNLYSDDIVDDVITIRENRNFHLRLFVDVQVVTPDSRTITNLLHV
jgi:hypothetical protein